MPLVSVRQAAEMIGKDRSTVTRAIEKGRLSATKDDLGRFLIDPAELERVFGTLRTPDDARTDAEDDDASDVHEFASAREVALLREMIEQERGAHERDRQTWDEERTFLRSMLERHTDQIKLLTDQRTPPPAPLPPPRRPLLARIFGRA